MADKSVIASLQAQIDSITAADACQSRDSREARVSDEKRIVGAAPVPPSAQGGMSQPQDDSRFSDPEAALKKIVALVNVSDRSERTIRERLGQAGFDQAAIDEAVERAKEYSFIDDMRFSEVLVRSRISQGKGSAGIVRELAEHGINADSVPGWPYEFPLDYDQELDRALGLLARKPPRSKNLREGAYRRLMQKGYPSSVASSAARIWTERVERK